MLLSELLNSISYDVVHGPIDVTITGVVELQDPTDKPGLLKWCKGPYQIAPDKVKAGQLLILPFKSPVNRPEVEGVTYIYCEDPKASIIAAINALVKHREIAMPELRFDGMRCGMLSHIMDMAITQRLRVGHNTIIGGEGFGFHRPPASAAGQPKTDNGQPPTRFPHIGSVKLGARVEVGSNTCIDRGAIGDTIIGDDTKIDNLVHIAHNVRIGQRCLIVAGAVIGGSAVIGDDVFIGINASIKNKVRIGNGATIGMGAVVTKDVPAGETWVGNPARSIAPAKAGAPHPGSKPKTGTPAFAGDKPGTDLKGRAEYPR